MAQSGDGDVSIVEGERASLLHAAAHARSAAMLTGTHGVVAPPLATAVIRLPAPLDLLPDDALWEERGDETEATALVRARASAVGEEDPVAILRAQLQLAHAALDAGDEAEARAAAARAAKAVDHAPAAHALLRVLAAGRDAAAVGAQARHVQHLVDHVSDALVRADFLVERGRLLEAETGAPSRESAAAFEAALALVPDHAAALYALEVALEATERWRDLAALLGRMAGLAGEPSAAAWLHVERALVLDRRLGDLPTARAALDRALELAPGIGAVRHAAVDHAVGHREDARLASLLISEVALEQDPARGTCLELDAALALLRAGDRAGALTTLQRAHARPRTSRLVDARVADELARLLDEANRPADVLAVRKAALTLVADPRAELLALRAVAAVAERAGAIDEAVLAVERARVLEPGDETLLAELDRLLLAGGRHDARATLWMRQSALAATPRDKTHALLVASAASAAAGREGDAARHREAAWLADPSAPGVFDSLAERLGPSAAERKLVEERVALYENAAARVTDVGRRLHLLEKAAWLWDDVAGDAARATLAYARVLDLDPGRRSAVAGLASAARRSRDARALARALLAEAELVLDDADRCEVRLRAAEALETVDAERSLAVAEELTVAAPAAVARSARELVTRLHAAAGRWELVARSLAGRAAAATGPTEKLALVLAEAATYAQRLASPERALAALEAARAFAGADAALTAAMVEALAGAGDAEALAAKLEEIAADAAPEARAAYLVRAAELAERRTDDANAVRLYLLAREAMPAERLVAERLRRLGVRAAVPRDYVPVALAAQRALESDEVPAELQQELLAAAPREISSLRAAERLARRAGGAPPLANALALGAEHATGLLAMRALCGLAAVVRWRLPESGDLEPWDRLLALGSRDAVVLDELVRRARPRVRGGDKAALGLAIEATRRRLEGASDDTERATLLVSLARWQERSGATADAAESARAALGLDPSSVAAAVVAASVARERGDRRAAIAAAKALASVTSNAKARAGLLRDAADLSVALKEPEAAAALLEEALAADPDGVLVAARLADIQGGRGAWADLARVLRRSLQDATTREAIVPMASELGEVARTRLRDPLLAIEALERSRSVAGDHVPTLLVLAELYIGQRAWDAALVALGDVVARTAERSEKLIALVGRASILGRVLGRTADAEKELRAALEIDPHDARALRALLAVPGLASPERAQLLSRLVIAEPDPAARVAALLALAGLRRELGDAGGAEGALVEAASLAPDEAMLERLREVAGGNAEVAARVLGRAIMRVREAGTMPGPAWLVRLGELELGLGRVDAAIEHLEEAMELDAAHAPARLLLATALAKRGTHDKAAAILAPLFDAQAPARPDLGAVRLLESSLRAGGRSHQALVARDLRALAGDLDAAALAQLDAAHVLAAGPGEPLSANVLRSFVMPGRLGKNAFWDAAAVAASLSGKLTRVPLVELGASPRDRVKPRTAHPIREIFDRLLRMFELVDVELAVSDNVASPLVACEDATWVIAPSSLAALTEAQAVAALARPLARIALGVPWFTAVPPEETVAAVVAVARQSAPAFAALPAERIEPLVAELELRARRAIDRKRRKTLDDLGDLLTLAPPLSVEAFVDAVVRTEARAAFLLSGDLRASLAAVATSDPAMASALRSPGEAGLASLLARPVARDLVAYALSGDATALRRSLGTLGR
ncbi:MAG: Exonuclease SbcC [Labilithrix sp.]|nr:Exonuclease SbcC [Labilithrix sp.]